MSSVRLSGIKACVFDAYGTLFDISSIARGAQDALGEQWRALSDLWRTKQMQYSWLRGLAGHHADYWQVTSDALDFAMQTLKIDNPILRQRLMSLHYCLSPYPEVPPVLQQLKAAGMKLAILSNGTPDMLESAVENAGLAGLFDAVISVEEIGVYKPHPSVYGLAPARLGMASDEICFLSANSWDAYSAKAFGFQVLWCNRFGQVPENLPATPDAEISDLSPLPEAVLG
jgi:2-haloacid dehalogenase